MRRCLDSHFVPSFWTLTHNLWSTFFFKPYPQFAPQGEVFWDHQCLFAPRKPALIFQNFKLKFLTTFDLIAVGIFWGNKICSLLYLILKKWNRIFWYFFLKTILNLRPEERSFETIIIFLRFAPRKQPYFQNFELKLLITFDLIAAQYLEVIFGISTSCLYTRFWEKSKDPKKSPPTHPSGQ